RRALSHGNQVDEADPRKAAFHKTRDLLSTPASRAPASRSVFRPSHFYFNCNRVLHIGSTLNERHDQEINISGLSVRGNSKQMGRDLEGNQNPVSCSSISKQSKEQTVENLAKHREIGTYQGRH